MVKIAKNAEAILRQSSDENGVGEPALLIESWQSSDCLSITQEGREVLINFENIDELCRLLKNLKTNRKK